MAGDLEAASLSFPSLPSVDIDHAHPFLFSFFSF